MLIGHKNLVKLFQKMTNNDKLFHAYLFFGESQVGKFLFAVSLANYLEYGIFEEPKKILEETLIVLPNEKNSIGIDSAKKIQNFLFQSPILSKKRVVIIRDAENLTSEAQNALLKIIEDNPLFSLVLFVSSDENSLLPALSSRLQKIYFSRVPESEIKEYLSEKYLKNTGIKKEDNEKINEFIKASFGRPGRAIEIMKNEKIKMKNLKADEIIENNQIDEFFENKLIELRNSGYKNIDFTKEVLRRLTLIKMFNTNKKLQLKALLNN